MAESNIFLFEIVDTKKVLDFNKLHNELKIVNPEFYNEVDEYYLKSIEKEGVIGLRWYCYIIKDGVIYKND